jgi:hypothetical protein
MRKLPPEMILLAVGEVIVAMVLPLEMISYALWVFRN